MPDSNMDENKKNRIKNFFIGESKLNKLLRLTNCQKMNTRITLV